MNDTVDTSPLLQCYVLLVLALPATFMPVTLLSGLAVLALLGGVIWAYCLRGRENELFKNHGRWMVRTFWISSLFFLTAIILSGSIISANADSSDLERMTGLIETGAGTPEDIAALMTAFIEKNKTLITVTSLAFFAPAVLHSVLRFVKGYRRADAGKPVENVTSWLI